MNARHQRIARDREPADAPSKLDVFRLRCWARAYLFAAGELELHEAVDPLQHDAEVSGLVRDIGQDEVQRLLSSAFAAVRPEPEVVERVPDALPDEDRRDGAAQSTLNAATHLVQQNDPERLKAWLLQYPAAERAVIIAHIKWGRS